ncbi:MAG: ATP-grasp domain-containing protein [Bacteroidetes bacterium]|nr:ATP-grasp domain-containing protein [Bacteroidota bacterium]MBL6943414.1 ATP-grasp domain-containing protein [Bacteroidales bacterium]
MKVGITYDLRSEYLKMGFSEEETAEFDQEGTIDAIESILNELNFQTERIGHIKQLVARLSKGHRWDLVFNICEGMYGNGREAQVPALLDAYNIPYVFSSPLALTLTLDKGLTKRVIRDAGLATPEFYVVSSLVDTEKINLPFPLFAKPVAEGTGKGINSSSVINNLEELKNQCSVLLSEFNQAVLVEKYLTGREFTVGVVGTGNHARTVGTMEIVLKENAEENVYSYVNKEQCETLIEYKPVLGIEKDACEALALEAYKLLDCEDGGRVDIRMDENGNPNFLEINPLAGLHPEHSDLPILCHLNGIPYLELMRMIMNSAIKKVRIKTTVNDMNFKAEP